MLFCGLSITYPTPQSSQQSTHKQGTRTPPSEVSELSLVLTVTSPGCPYSPLTSFFFILRTVSMPHLSSLRTHSHLFT